LVLIWGFVFIHSDIGERQNVVDAATQLLSIFNKVLNENNLPMTTIAQLASPPNSKSQIDQMKPKPVAKQIQNNNHNQAEYKAKPSQPPASANSSQAQHPQQTFSSTYKVKPHSLEIMVTCFRVFF